MTNMRRRARLLSHAEQDAAFFAAMKRGEECDARSVQMLENLVRWGAEQPAWFGAPSPPSGFPSLSQGDHA